MNEQPLTDAQEFYSRAEIAAAQEFNFPIYEVHHVFNLLGEAAGKATLLYADVTGKHSVDIAELVHILKPRATAKPYVPLFGFKKIATIKPATPDYEWKIDLLLCSSIVVMFAVVWACVVYNEQLDRILTDVFDLVRYFWNK